MRLLFISFVFAGIPIVLLFSSITQMLLMLVLQLGFYFLSKYKKLSPYQVGDGAYYLGFIFTLMALLFSFTPSFNSSFSFNAEQILGNFGVAISSTIVGIFLRIIEVQYGDDVDVDISLANAGVVTALNDFSMRVSLIESDYEKTTSTLLKTYEATLSELNESSQKNIDYEKKRIEAFQNEMKSLSLGFKKTLGDSISKMDARSNTLIEKALVRVEANSNELLMTHEDALENRLKSFIEKVDLYGNELSGFAETVKGVSDQCSATVDTSKKLNGLIDDVSSSLTKNEASFKESYDVMVSFNGAITSALDAGKTITGVVNDLSSKIGDLAGNISELDDSSATLNRIVNNQAMQEQRLEHMTTIRDKAFTINNELNDTVVESASRLLKALA